jgi:hypothetical protein
MDGNATAVGAVAARTVPPAGVEYGMSTESAVLGQRRQRMHATPRDGMLSLKGWVRIAGVTRSTALLKGSYDEVDMTSRAFGLRAVVAVGCLLPGALPAAALASDSAAIAVARVRDAAPPPPDNRPPPDVAPSSSPEPAPQPPAAGPLDGQWVYTSQYGWIWMPYDRVYTYVPDDDGYPAMYVYGQTIGWRWVTAPWIFGWGPAPHWGPRGRVHFVWHMRPWFSPRPYRRDVVVHYYDRGHWPPHVHYDRRRVYRGHTHDDVRYRRDARRYDRGSYRRERGRERVREVRIRRDSPRR